MPFGSFSCGGRSTGGRRSQRSSSFFAAWPHWFDADFGGICAIDFVLSAGAAGSDALKASGAPLVDALIAVYGQHTWLASFVNFVGLAGLVASFFSIIYAYSRQIFALSRAGYLPKACH